MPFKSAADLRRLRHAAPAYAIPADHFGNSVTLQVIKPPQLISQAAINTSRMTVSPLGHRSSQQQPEFLEVDGTKLSDSSPVDCQHSRLQNAFAAAACAIHQGTQSLQADPLAGARSLAGMLDRMSVDYWQAAQATSAYNPFRDGASNMSSWRKSSIERPDFGQGPAHVVAAKTLPLKHKMAFLTSGPGNDGALCFTGFRASDFQHICSSQVLQQLAPGAHFIKCKPRASKTS